MPTAYLSASLLKELTDVSVTPGAGNTGYPLIWNNATGWFELAVLGVAGGGTGTSRGSITGTGALTFAAGGTNQDINLNPSGTGRLIAGSVAGTEATINLRSQEGVETGFTVSLPNGSANYLNGIYLRKGSGFFGAANADSAPGAFLPYFQGKDTGSNFFALGFVGFSGTNTPILSAIYFSARNSTDTGGVSASGKAFYFENGYSGGTSSAPCLTILGNGDSTFHSSTESTSTTTGAVRIDGGLGVAKNVNVGGNLRFVGGTVPATAASAGTTGDIRYDGSHLYLCTATNTWVRTALSTW